jgi:cytidylate kinase-like protein
LRYDVVCITSELGAGSEPVGRALADRLGFRYFDDEIIALASEKAGIDSTVVAGAEHHSSLLSRLMDVLLTPPMHVDRILPITGDGPYYSRENPPPVRVPQETLRRLIQAAIVEIADRGTAVVVAHGASIVLRGRDDVLRLHVTASPETRAERLRRAGKLLSPDDAERAVTESDRERQRYLKRSFDIDRELPTHYDLVINTDALGVEQAVGAVAAAAGG